MVSDGIGGYHGLAELDLLCWEGPLDVSACAVCGTRVMVSMVVRGWGGVGLPDGPRPFLL
jgi:hypothetical protein